MLSENDGARLSIGLGEWIKRWIRDFTAISLPCFRYRELVGPIFNNPKIRDYCRVHHVFSAMLHRVSEISFQEVSAYFISTLLSKPLPAHTAIKMNAISKRIASLKVIEFKFLPSVCCKSTCSAYAFSLKIHPSVSFNDPEHSSFLWLCSSFVLLEAHLHWYFSTWSPPR